MSIQLTIELRNADVLRSFADWWDQQAPGDVGTEDPVPYTLADPTPEPTKINPPKPEHTKAVLDAIKDNPVPRQKTEPAPASTAIITPTLDEFTKAVKAWFQADAATRGPKVKAALDALGIAKLAEVPVDKFAAVLTDLGVS